VRSISAIPSLDLTGFEAGPIIDRTDHELRQLYRRGFDGFEIVLKVTEFHDSVGKGDSVKEIENLMNLRHPLITAPIGFILRPREMIVGRKHSAIGSLADVISEGPVWWTPTAKAKAIVGVGLALRFAHGLGLLHGHLSSSSVIFDGEHRIQVADFSGIRLVNGSVDAFSGAEWSPSVDVSAFSMLVFEIVIGGSRSPPPRTGNGICFPPSMPTFLSEIIEDGLSAQSHTRRSFVDIVDVLKRHDFGIDGGVDSDEVSHFVKWVESAENSMKIEGFPVRRGGSPVERRSGLPALRSLRTAGGSSGSGSGFGRGGTGDGRGRRRSPPPPAPLPRLRK
jgi:hypothetical protein